MSIIYKKNHLAFLLAITMFLLVIFGPQFALAQVAPNNNGLDNSPITRSLCNVFEMANGNIGKAIAIFAIVAVGFGFFTGKFSIALVIGITLGIGILFGAPKIIAALVGGQAVDCNTITSGEAEVCDGSLSFATLTPMSNVTNAMAIEPFSAVPSSNRIINFESLFSVKCKNLGNQKQWVLADIVAPVPTNSPIAAPTTFASFGNDSQLTSPIPTAATPAAITLTHQYICPKLTAKLFVATAGNCANAGSGGLTGAFKLTDNAGGGIKYDVCVAGDAGATKKVLEVPTPLSGGYIGTSAIAHTTSRENLTISKFGLVGHTATATVNGITYTAVCTAGASGNPGYWNVSPTGGTPISATLASITLN